MISISRASIQAGSSVPWCEYKFGRSISSDSKENRPVQVFRLRPDLAFASDLYHDAKSVAPCVCVCVCMCIPFAYMCAGIYVGWRCAPATILCLPWKSWTLNRKRGYSSSIRWLLIIDVSGAARDSRLDWLWGRTSFYLRFTEFYVEEFGELYICII